MKLQVPFIQLPLQFDAHALAAEIAALEESSWLPHPQGFAGNSMLPLVAVDGDPGNESFTGPMGTTSFLRACPYLLQVIGSLGVTVGRSRLMRLSGHSEVSEHVDQGYYWAERVRVHVPIVTQPTVRFDCGGASVNMRAGECWIFDTWRQHRVLNDAIASRVHLVVDTVGGTRFWEMVARGRPVPGPAAGSGWNTDHLPPSLDSAVDLSLESINVPTVMSPWELSTHLGSLMQDALPDPRMQHVQQITARLMRTWRALWAEYGTSEAGKPRFRHEMDRFAEEVRLPAMSLVLRNNLVWYSALMTLVVAPAVHDAAGRQDDGRHDMADRA